jgi:hypothetical protein
MISWSTSVGLSGSAVMVMVMVVCDVCKMPTTEDRGIRSVVDGSGRCRRIKERELVGKVLRAEA